MSKVDIRWRIGTRLIEKYICSNGFHRTDIRQVRMSTKEQDCTGGGIVMSSKKKVIQSMGGKGGVGKTSIMTRLAEWFDSNRIPVQLLEDLGLVHGRALDCSTQK
jgi:hypothetical protein